MLEKFLKFLGEKRLLQARRSIDSAISRTFSLEKRRRLFWKENSTVRHRDRLVSPARPSAEAVNIYGEFLIKVNPRKVMILGSTPELRDLIREQNISNPVIADFSIEMIKNNLLLCKKADGENEIWLKSDWLDLPLEKKYFDCILGDLVIGQFISRDQPKLISKIAELLKPGGVFITRIHETNETLKNMATNEIVKKTLENMNAGNERQKYIILLWRLRDALRDPTTGLTDPEKILRELEKFFPENELQEKVSARLKNVALKRKTRSIDYPSQTEKEVETLLKSVFASLEKKRPKSHEEEEYFPIYKLGLAD